MSRLYGDLVGAADALNIAREAKTLAEQAIVEIGDIPIERAPVTGRCVMWIKPKSGNTVSVANLDVTGCNSIALAGAGLDHPLPLNSATLRQSTYRTQIRTSGGANLWASVRENVTLAFPDNFRLAMRWAAATTLTNQRGFCGFYNSTGSLAAGDPSAYTDSVFFGYDGGDTNLFVMHNDASGTCTKVDLGGGFPVDTSTVYEGILTADPDVSGQINYYIRNLATGAEAEGVLTSNLPTAGTLLAAQMGQNSGTTATITYFEFISLYHEQYR